MDGRHPENPGLSAGERWHQVWAHRDRLVRLAASRLGGRADAEDVVQDAMISVAMNEQIGGAAVGRMLTTIVKRRVADAHRERAVSTRALAHLEHTPSHRSAGPEEVVMTRAHARAVIDVARTAPELERAVLLARATGYGSAEAASLIGVSYKSAESSYTRVRSRIRIALVGFGAGIVAALRRLRHGRMVTASAATTAFTVALLVAVARPPFTDTPPAGGPEGHAARGVSAPLAGPVIQTGPPDAGALRPVGEAHSSVSGGSAPRAPLGGTPAFPDLPPVSAHPGPVGSPHVVQIDLGTISYTPDGKSPVDEAAACIQTGISLDPRHAGCPPPG